MVDRKITGLEVAGSSPVTITFYHFIRCFCSIIIIKLMIGIIIAIIAVYWLLLSLFVYRFAKKTFRKYKDYPRIEVPAHMQSSVRKDFGKWNQAEIIKGCFLRFPLHITTMIAFLSTYSVIGTLQRYLKYPKSMVDLFRINAGRLAFKVCFNLDEDFDYREAITTPIVASNHVCWADFVYMGSCWPLVSFVAKKDVQKIPIINIIATYTRTFYVDRSSSDNRQKTKQGILQRVDNFQNKPQMQEIPLVIYPEGSCTNGRSIMSFNNGAFQALCPITLYSLKYQCKEFHLGHEEITTDVHVLLTLCLKPTLRVKKEQIAAKEGETVEEYRQRCRKKLGEMTGFALFDCSYKEQMDYIHKIEALARERYQQKIKNKA